MSEIGWATALGGAFDDASNWTGGIVPNNLQTAVIAAPGPDFTVTSSDPEVVYAISFDSNVTFDILDGDFDVFKGGSNAGLIDVSPGDAAFEAAGLLDNYGVIELDQALGGSASSNLIVDPGGLTLKGGGTIFLNNPNQWTNAHVPAPPGYSTDFIASHAGATLTNVDNTIYGAGQIGQSPLRVVNERAGVIDANLSFDLNMKAVAGGIVNDGLMESTGSGGLYVVSSTVDQGPGGVIAGNGGIVYFSYADIVGGSLSSSGIGHFYWDHGETVLDGTQGGLTNNAYVFISDGAQLGLKGTITNNDEFEVGTGQEASTVRIHTEGVTLKGDGVIVLGGRDPDTAIKAVTSGAELINLGNTIEGQGVIGGGGLFFVNKGTVDAGARDALAIVDRVANAGLIEATGFGGLTISASVANSGGTILADTRMTLDGATISGGTLNVAGSLTFSGSDKVSAAILGSGQLIEASGKAVLANAGGFAGQMTIEAGGTAMITNAGGFAGQMTIEAGGRAVITDGVGSVGQVTLDGGALDVRGAAAGGDVTFAGPAILEIGASPAPGSTLPNTLSDFDARGDRLDLAGISFVAGAAAALAGSVLTLSEGGESYNIDLAGEMASAFVVKSDGHGGTMIIAQPPKSGVQQSAAANVAPDVRPQVHGSSAPAGGNAQTSTTPDGAHEASAGHGALGGDAGGYLGESHAPYVIENSVAAVDMDGLLNGHVHLTQVAGLGTDWLFQ